MLNFTPILTAPAQSHSPPVFEGFDVASPINLPAGGLEGSPEENSVIEVLSLSTTFREYYLLNTGNRP